MPSGAGYLNAAFGAGGVAGGILTIGLIGRDRLVPPLIFGAFMWGAAFLLLGAWPTAVGAFALLAVAGASRMLLNISGITLLQRTTPDYARGRVFGVLEGGAMLGSAIGSASVPLFALAGGPRASVAGTGALLVVAAGAAARVVGGLERSAPPCPLGCKRHRPAHVTVFAPHRLLRCRAAFAVRGSRRRPPQLHAVVR